jgi:hypothetical protein
MKIVVFSDNHQDVASVDRILFLHPDAERMISLGDSEMSESELTKRNIFGVCGNYPFEPKFPDQLLFEFEGHRTFITHGHHFYVKTGLYYLTTQALELHCDLALFGHTHRYLITEQDGVILVNPGSTAYPKGTGKKTYAVIQIETNRIKVEIMDLHSGIPLLTYVKKY